MTEFEKYCLDGNIEMVKILIEDMKPLYNKQEAMLGLFEACKGGHLEIVKLLTENTKYVGRVWKYAHQLACDVGRNTELIEYTTDVSAKIREEYIISYYD